MAAAYLALGSGPTERVEAYQALLQTGLDPEMTTRIRTAVKLGLGVADPRFGDALAAIEQAKKRGGRKRKDAHAHGGEQADPY